MATTEHNHIADPRPNQLARRQFITSLGATAAALAAPAAALATPPAPLWPGPEDIAAHTALIERGLELCKLEDEAQGNTDPWGNSPTNVFTVNAIYLALQDSPRYVKEHDFFRSNDVLKGPTFLPGELLSHDDAVRGLCADMFRAGQLVTAAMMAAR